jgi:hypothetical protein
MRSAVGGCVGAAIKIDLLHVVGWCLVGVYAADHLVPGRPVHHDVLPFGGWDFAEEEVDFSSEPLSASLSLHCGSLRSSSLQLP